MCIPKRSVALIVDDDPAVLKIGSRCLADMNIAAELFLDGERAWEWLEKSRAPLFAAVDQLLPRMSGYELCRRIRATPRLATLPLLMTTARQDLQDEVRAVELGAMFLAKPFRLKDLRMAFEDLRVRAPTQTDVRRVMIVDDDDDIRETLRGLVAEEGYEPIVARDAFEALALLPRTKPKLMLLDIMMPGLDGIEFASRIRVNGPTVVLVSANEHVASHARDIGAASFLRKPFALEDLVGVIHGVMNA